MGSLSTVVAVSIKSIRRFGGIAGIISRKHMRMPSDELVHQPAGDLVNTKRILGIRFADPRLKHGLQQHIAQFLAHVVTVVSFHRVDVFVGFLKQILEQ